MGSVEYICSDDAKMVVNFFEVLRLQSPFPRRPTILSTC